MALSLHALMALFLWVAVAVILRDLFRKAIAGADTVLGAICGNAIIYLLMPTAFGINPDVTPLFAETWSPCHE